MNEIAKKSLNRTQRARRTQAQVRGTAARPRLSLRVSNLNVYAQIIDDENRKTLVSSTSTKEKTLSKASLTDKATWVGADIAKKAKDAKVKSVVFDRGHKPYHGRVKSAAEAARKEGLEF